MLPFPLLHPMHGIIYLLFFGFFGIFFSIIVLIPFWVIFKKAGFSPFLSLLMLLPFISIFVLYFLAFARWNVVPATAVYPQPPVPYRPPV